MFSPEAASGRRLDRAAALRGAAAAAAGSIDGVASTNDHTSSSLRDNPRRRQRTASADSLAVRQSTAKRRKRSALANDTFDAPQTDAQQTQGPAGRSSARSAQHRANGTAAASTTLRKNSSNAGAGAGVGATDALNLNSRHWLSAGVSGTADTSFDASGAVAAVRGKASGALRGGKEKRNRHDDGVELARTDHYALTRDRQMPSAVTDILGSEPWHAKFCPDLGFAVVLTHSRAIVWKYAHSRLGMHDTGVHVINLPAQLGSGYDKLPTGTLVHDAGAGDLALLVFMHGCKVVYFESVRAAAGSDSVASQDFEELTGSIGNAFSSEHITQIAEAESDGFVVSTSMGRLFHLSVRDSQGRPSISTQQLRLPSSEKVGIFGSIRNAITGGTGQDIASISPLPGRSRSSRQVLVATAKGDAQLWSIARHGAKTVEREWNLREALEVACLNSLPSISPNSLTLLDLSLIGASSESSADEQHVVTLVSGAESSSTRYFLISMVLRAKSLDLGFVSLLRVYSGPSSLPELSARSIKPTLLIPPQGHVAFVVFDTKIIISSLDSPESLTSRSPSSQLKSESPDSSEPYQECLFFSRKLPYHTAGCAAQAEDDRTERASCDVMIHGFGHVRLSVLPVPESESKSSRQANLIRSRLEQVVFYGAMTDNFLNFRDEHLWKDVATEDIELATTHIIDSILNSSSPHIPILMPSMDQQLKLRAQAITDLNRFVQQWTLSSTECWRLLWAAEKLASARAILALYDQHLSIRTNLEQKILLEELIDMIHENDRDQNEPDRGESDAVRHYLVRDVARLSSLIAWTQQSIDELVQEGVQNMEELVPLVVQAADILVAALETAWKFRDEHIEAFGLGRDNVENGVYQQSYADMPSEPWTATETICARVKLLVPIVKSTAVQLDENETSDNQFDDELVAKLVQQASSLTDCAFRCWEEQCRWVESSADATIRAKSKDWRKLYKATRLELLEALVDMSSHIAAADLAEKYLDMESLALVLSRVEEQGEEWSRQPDPEEQEQGENILREVRDRTDKYFDLYGKSWAHAFFDQQADSNGAARMMVLFPHRQSFLTEYMQTKKADDRRFNKLAWINQVRGEENFAEAAKDLWLAERYEQRLWAKQVGLALTKICKYAAVEKGQLDERDGLRDVRACTQRAKITDVQQRLYEYVRPLLLRAIDPDAELDLALASFGDYVKGRPTLEENLRNTMKQLVRRRVIPIEEMIEILTIISPSDQLPDEEQFGNERFYLALWLLHASGLEVNFHDRAVLHERLIWRRVILQDDWIALNRTEGKTEDDVGMEMRQSALYKTLRAGYESGLFEKHAPLSPQSLHPAGETVGQLREAGVYPKRDDAYLARLAKDLAAEDDALEEITSKARLEMWWKGVIESAKADVRGEQDAYAKLRQVQEEDRRKVKEYSRRMQEEQSVQHTAMLVDGADGVPNDEHDAHMSDDAMDGAKATEPATATTNGDAHPKGLRHRHEASTNGGDHAGEGQHQQADMTAGTKPAKKENSKTGAKKNKKQPVAEKKSPAKKKTAAKNAGKKDVEGDVAMAS